MFGLSLYLRELFILLLLLLCFSLHPVPSGSQDRSLLLLWSHRSSGQVNFLYCVGHSELLEKFRNDVCNAAPECGGAVPAFDGNRRQDLGCAVLLERLRFLSCHWWLNVPRSPQGKGVWRCHVLGWFLEKTWLHVCRVADREGWAAVLLQPGAGKPPKGFSLVCVGLVASFGMCSFCFFVSFGWENAS